MDLHVADPQTHNEMSKQTIDHQKIIRNRLTVQNPYKYVSRI